MNQHVHKVTINLHAELQVLVVVGAPSLSRSGANFNFRLLVAQIRPQKKRRKTQAIKTFSIFDPRLAVVVPARSGIVVASPPPSAVSAIKAAGRRRCLTSPFVGFARRRSLPSTAPFTGFARRRSSPSTLLRRRSRPTATKHQVRSQTLSEGSPRGARVEVRPPLILQTPDALCLKNRSKNHLESPRYAKSIASTATRNSGPQKSTRYQPRECGAG